MTEKNEENSIEKEIIASYLEGQSTLAIRKEYDISEFELAYILGKHNVPARQSYRKLGDDTTIVYIDGALRIPKSIITTLGLKHGQKIRFVIVDKQHLTLQLQEMK
jgi:hypothetical protein